MKTIELSLEPLKKVSIALAEAVFDVSNPKYRRDYMRDAVIQRFKFSFELAWKALQRFFQLNQRPIVNNIKDIIREAGKLGLIDSVELWFEFHKARNLTSHTYGEPTAEEVYQKAVVFSSELKKLIINLEAAID